MSDSVFVDSNIWIYSYSDHHKSEIAKNAIVRVANDVIISTQVVNELCFNLVRKVKKTSEEASKVCIDLMSQFYTVTLSATTVREALQFFSNKRFSLWDSLIVASALENGCTTLLTKDLHHGQVIRDQLTIHNPFQETTA